MMITRQSTKAIHTAKTRARLTDAEYRAALARVGDRHGLRIWSSKDLPQNLVGEALAEIGVVAGQAKRKGWQPGQLARVRRYQGMAGLVDDQVLAIVREVSGQTALDSPKLSQYHFDRVMVRLEMQMADAVAAGKAAWPADIQPCYWRYRQQAGTCNTRQARLIRELWAKLQEFLPPHDQAEAYLVGIAAHACGRKVRDAFSLTPWQAANLIDALRDRLTHATRRSA